jgi:hypothetical protein
LSCQPCQLWQDKTVIAKPGELARQAKIIRQNNPVFPHLLWLFLLAPILLLVWQQQA